MGSLEDFARTNYQPVNRQLGQHPKGWEPGVEWDGKAGTITSAPDTAAKADWTHLLTQWGFDPAEFEVLDDTVRVSTWEGFIKNKDGQVEKTQLWAHSARIRRKTSGLVDVAALREILTRAPGKHNNPYIGSCGLVVSLSDWQLGKSEGGGSAATVERIMRMIVDVEARWIELRRIGRKLDTLCVFGLGDIVEGCDGFYSMQQFGVDLDRRTQVSIACELITEAVRRWSVFAPRVVVAAVPGNHGENRKNGKAFTTFGDNDDVAAFESVARAFKLAGTFPHVSFVIPRNELSITLNVHGAIVALAHGHQARATGASAAAKLLRWWEGQAFGMQPAGDATILFTGHFHHLSVVTQCGRTHFQAPSLDGGSEWFTASTGKHSGPGTLTAVVGTGVGTGDCGWDDVKVL